MYQTTSSKSVIRIADGAVIHADPGNTDWQVYQAWLAAGNEPTPYAAPPAPAAAIAITPVQADELWTLGATL